MYAPYGVKIGGSGMRMSLHPCGCTSVAPPTAEPVVSDRFPRYPGCPYPRHGLICWTDETVCLRTDMEEIAQNSLRRRSGTVHG